MLPVTPRAERASRQLSMIVHPIRLQGGEGAEAAARGAASMSLAAALLNNAPGPSRRLTAAPPPRDVRGRGDRHQHRPDHQPDEPALAQAGGDGHSDRLDPVNVYGRAAAAAAAAGRVADRPPQRGGGDSELAVGGAGG